MTISQMRKRAFIIFLLIASVLLALIVRVGYWQIIRGEELKEAVMRQQTNQTDIIASRGTIYDRNQKVLAESATVNTVVCNPQQIKKDGSAGIVAAQLSRILDVDEDEILEKLNKNNQYQRIKKRISVEEADEIKKLKDSSVDKEMAKLFSGVYFEEDSKRYYQYNIASHIVGFTGYDNNGMQGIELTFDKYLTGRAGALLSARTASGNMTAYQYEDDIDAQKGDDVVLTIDETIQAVLEKHLEQACIENELKEGACGIIMNPKTGEIYAMATKPDFDLNDPASTQQFQKYALDVQEIIDLAELDAAKKEAEKNDEPFDEDAELRRIQKERRAREQEYEKSKKSDDDEEESEDTEDREYIADETMSDVGIAAVRNKMWRNKAISDTYEPGSTFKILTAAMALEEGIVTLDSQFNCGGSKQVLDYRINCHKTAGHGPENFAQGVINSCNVVFMELGLSLGNKFQEYFKAFGLTEKSDIELIGESGSVYYHNKLSETDLATSSFGQGFSITPIQLVTAISAVINGGNLMKPQIVKEIRNSGGIVKSFYPQIVNRVISEQTSATMRNILEQVVADPKGTGKNAYIKGYRLGGKTGTSEKGRKNDKRIASFVGFAPADDPQLICLIMLDEPQVANKYGGTIAAPVAGSILEEALEYMGVERQYTQQETQAITVSVPDLREMTVEQAKASLEGKKLNIKVSGKGDVVLDQLPMPGISVAENSTLIVYTEQRDENKKIQVPNLSGMSIEAAKKHLTDIGLNFETAGAGLTDTEGAYAFKQSIEPGTMVEPATVVSVEFRHSASD